jgi:hypothetical protein
MKTLIKRDVDQLRSQGFRSISDNLSYYPDLTKQFRELGMFNSGAVSARG